MELAPRVTLGHRSKYSSRLSCRARTPLTLAVTWLLPAATGLLATAPPGPPPAPPSYQVYAIRYAVLPGFPVSQLVAGADTARRLDLAMMVWWLKGSNGRNVLVDAGFYRQKFLDRWKPRDYVKPSDAVLKAGLKPEDVTDVVVSHVHWDHMDGIDLFARARVWIQREEYEYYVTDSGWVKNRGIDSVDAAMLADLRRQGRVKLVDGDAIEAIPGITLYTGGKHTYASEYAAVRARAGTVVVASDNLYLYENLERHAPIAQTLDSASNLRAQDRMRTIASSVRLIVPGHDPAVFARFPRPGAGVAKIE